METQCTTFGWVFCWRWDVGGRTGPLSTESMRVYAVLEAVSPTKHTFILKGQSIGTVHTFMFTSNFSWFNSRLFGIRDWHPSFGVYVVQCFFGIRDWHPSVASNMLQR